MNRKVILPIVALAALGGFLLWEPASTVADESGLTLYGNVDIREVSLSFRVSGRLMAMDQEEGDAVIVGDALAHLDREPFEQALAVADAKVAQARAQLGKLQAGYRPQEIRRAAARVAEAEADSAYASAEVTRLEDLIADGATSQRELDAAIARHDASRARLSSVREDLSLLQEGFRPEDIAAAQAQLAQSEAQAQQARTRLADTTLVSPSDGTLISRIREPGSIVGAGEPVYTLSLDDPVWVRAYVDEPNLGLVRTGMSVRVRSDSSEESHAGQIGFISPRAEFTPRSVETEALRTDLVYRLRIVVSDSDGRLRQGMPVTVSVGEG